MTEEIKEILYRLKRIDHKEYSCGFDYAERGSFDEDCRCFEERKIMADYITNLQQDLDKANDIIEKDRQFNQGRLLDVAKLKEENERLKEELKNRPIVDFTFDVYKELEDYKSRCEKASVILNNIYLLDNVTITNNAVIEIDKAINILNGSDENE